jgi:PEP-CTERM motif
LYINSNTTINSFINQDVYIGQLGHGGITNPTVTINAPANFDVFTGVIAEQNSIVNMNGGSAWNMFAINNAQINMFGGFVFNGLVSQNTAKLNVKGGGVSNIYMSGTSEANFEGSGGVVELTNSSIFNFTKGTVTDIYGMDSSRLELFMNNASFTNPASNVPKTTLLGGTRNFDQYIITGRLAGATPITFNYWYQTGSPSSGTIQAAIPEPTTLALFAVGGVGFVGRLRRSRNK